MGIWGLGRLGRHPPGYQLVIKLHQGPDGGWRRIELGDFVLVHHGPEPVVFWIEGRALELKREQTFRNFFRVD